MAVINRELRVNLMRQNRTNLIYYGVIMMFSFHAYVEPIGLFEMVDMTYMVDFFISAAKSQLDPTNTK